MSLIYGEDMMKRLPRLCENLGLSRNNGLVEVRGHSNWKEQIPEEIQLSLKVKKQLDILQPDAFYHFHNVPLILFFENPADDDIPRIHRQAWCFNRAPVIFINRDTGIEVYNAFHYEDRGLKKITVDEADIGTRFSFWELQSGNTWKWIEENFFKGRIKKYRVDTCLLNNIRAAVTKLENEGIPLKTANVIILRLIFTRYLIDRGVIMDEKFIEGDPSEKERRKESFNRLIPDRERLYLFFDHLKERFNGNLFERHDDENMIKQEHLELLSMLFKGKLETGERFLFDVYDFSIIPIELISGIYESIIDDKKREENAAIYTPTFLVDFVLQQTVERYLEENDAGDCRVLDPACGSGIFLVEAFRRMAEREMSRGKICDDTLKELLETNIFGIDKDETALNVAIFSLYIALLDYKEPKDIKKIKLPELLNKRLFRADFFDTGHAFNHIIKNAGLKFIIGNPPWRSDKSPLHLMYAARYPVTDFQIAQTFMIRTGDFSQETTESAFVVTSSVIHKAKKFREYFLDNFYMDKVLDLSSVRRFIFKGAVNPAAIVFFRCADRCDTKENSVNHLSLKPNVFLTHFDTLVIEKNDVNLIKQKYFMEYRWMWKTVFYGNILDFHMLKRLEDLKENLKKIIADNDGIFEGNGILEGKPKEEPFSFLVGFPVVETEQITSYYTVVDKNTRRLKLEDTYLEKGRKPELYEGEHVLLRRRMTKETKLTVSYTESSCVFRNSAYSIASRNCPDELKEMYGIFISKLFTYFQFMTSANWGIYLPEVNLDEYLSFPHARIKDKKKFVALVDRFISYYKEYYTGTLRPENIPLPPEFEQINRMVNEAYEIDDIEKDLIDYVLDVSRYLFQEGKAYKTVLRKVKDAELKQYGQIFYDHFASIYNSPGEYFQVEYFYLDYFAAMKFKIVPDKPSGDEEIVRSAEKDPEKIIFTALAQKASLYKLTDRLYVNKVIKGFEDDFFYIIKPNEFKSWHRAIAHIDLAEFIDAINKAESEEMKEKNNG